MLCISLSVQFKILHYHILLLFHFVVAQQAQANELCEYLWLIVSTDKTEFFSWAAGIMFIIAPNFMQLFLHLL